MKLKDEIKERVITEKTLDLVYEKGFSGIKMADLAKEVGISPSTLYVYFKNKEDLIVSICVKLFNQLSKSKNDELSDELPYKMKLKKMWITWVDFGLNNAKEMSFLNQIKQSPYYDKVPKSVKEAKYKSGQNLFERGKKEGLIKNIDNTIIMSIVGSVSSETIKLINNNQLKFENKDMDLMFSILWDAIKA